MLPDYVTHTRQPQHSTREQFTLVYSADSYNYSVTVDLSPRLQLNPTRFTNLFLAFLTLIHDTHSIFFALFL